MESESDYRKETQYLYLGFLLGPELKINSLTCCLYELSALSEEYSNLIVTHIAASKPHWPHQSCLRCRPSTKHRRVVLASREPRMRNLDSCNHLNKVDSQAGLRAKERVTVAQRGNSMRSAVCTALYTGTPLA
jgi:hypothetical protein